MTDPDKVKARMAEYAASIMKAAIFFEIRAKCNSFRSGWLRLIELVGADEASDFVRSIDQGNL